MQYFFFFFFFSPMNQICLLQEFLLPPPSLIYFSNYYTTMIIFPIANPHLPSSRRALGTSTRIAVPTGGSISRFPQSRGGGGGDPGQRGREVGTEG